MNWIAWTAIGMVLYAIAEYYGKDWVETKSLVSYDISLGCYIIMLFVWFAAFQKNPSITVLNTIWTLLYAFIGVIIGMVCWHEHINRYQTAGLVLAIVAMYLLCKE